MPLDATRPLHTTGCRDDAWLTSDQRLYNILRLVVLLTGKSMCFNIGKLAKASYVSTSSCFLYSNCIYIQLYVHIHICMHIHMYMCMYIELIAILYLYVRLFIYTIWIYIYIGTHGNTCKTYQEIVLTPLCHLCPGFSICHMSKRWCFQQTSVIIAQ